MLIDRLAIVLSLLVSWPIVGILGFLLVWLKKPKWVEGQAFAYELMKALKYGYFYWFEICSHWIDENSNL